MTGAGPPDPHDPPALRRRLAGVGRRMVAEWSHDRLPDTAASVAFYAVLSLLPAFLALASILGLLDSIVGGDVAQRVEAEVLDFLGTILTDEADGTLDAARDLFEGDRPGLLTFSLAVALWTLARAFAALVRALDVVYDLDEKRSWVSIRGTALVVAIGSVLSGAVMLGVLVIGPLFGTGEDIAAEVGLGDQFVFLWNVLRIPLAVVVLILWSATVFHIGPDHHTPWRWDLPGAVLTTALWLLFSGGLRLYLELAAGNAVFGALGGALIVLLWFWLLSLAVLLGGELNQVLLAEFGADRHRAEHAVPDGIVGDVIRSGGVDGVAELSNEGPGVER